MNCNDLIERIPALASGMLPADEREGCLAHVEACEACADALHGALDDCVNAELGADLPQILGGIAVFVYGCARDNAQ